MKLNRYGSRSDASSPDNLVFTQSRGCRRWGDFRLVTSTASDAFHLLPARDRLRCLATDVGLGRIFRSSMSFSSLENGDVKTFRCTTSVARKMALADDPSGWILLMFRKEEQEGRGHLCQSFPDGVEPNELQLADGERVFGVYRDTYFFTPLALHITGNGTVTRISWRDVTSCSTKHGSGNKTSTLNLSDGSTATVRISDLATGWAGRTSQLFHQMIETFGKRASLGPTLKPLDEFLASATDAYSLFPNLEPHPDLNSLRKSLAQLAASDGVTEIRVIVPDDDPDTGVGLVIQSTLAPDDFSNWALSLGADGVIAASEHIVRQFEPIPDGQRILHVVWD